MKILCTICRGFYHPNDPDASLRNFSSVTCGHSFHTTCLELWTKNKKDCPQCRHSATVKNVHQCFLQFDEDESGDADLLQCNVDSLTSQVSIMRQHMKNAEEDKDKFEVQVSGLRDRCRELERLSSHQEQKNGELTDELKIMKKYAQQSNNACKEAEKAKNDLKLFTHIDRLLQGKQDDIEDLISVYSQNPSVSINNLVTTCTLLKDELKKQTNNKQILKNDLQNHIQKSREFKKRCSDLNKELELCKSDLDAAERENKGMDKKVKALQQSIESPSGDVRNSLIQRLITESPAPLLLKRQRVEDEEMIDLTPEIIKTVSKTNSQFSSSATNSNIFRGESPYLRLESASVLFNPKSRAPCVRNPYEGKSVKCSSKWARDNVLPGDNFGFDGLGGRSKIDEFPKPAKVKIIPRPLKKAPKIVSKTTTGTRTTQLTDFWMPKL